MSFVAAYYVWIPTDVAEVCTAMQHPCYLMAGFSYPGAGLTMVKGRELDTQLFGKSVL